MLFSRLTARVLCGVVGVCLLVLEVWGQSVDSRTPEDWVNREREHANDHAGWPWTRVDQLQGDKDELVAELAKLPQRHPVAPRNRFGYHSSYERNESSPSSEDTLIEFSLNRSFLIRSIALAPAVVPSETGQYSYAFPRRFKIESLSDSGESNTLADWLLEDFPDPGQLPVVFSDLNVEATRVRLTVPRDFSMPEESYFALGEVYIWGGAKESLLVDNIALWASTKVTATNQFSLPPKWDLDYLRDGVSGLGFPLHTEKGELPDLMIRSEEGQELAEDVRLIIDLGEETEIGRFDVWPALSPDGLALSGLGFPSEIVVDVSNDPSFSTYRAIESDTAPNRGQTGALFSVCVRPPSVRYLRVGLEGLPTLNGKRILGLGEIAIYDSQGNLTTGRIVSQEGIPTVYSEQLSRLLDGYCWGRQILPDLEWIKGLALRRPLEQHLASIETELASAQAVWQYLQVRLIVGGSIMVTLFLVGVVLFQRVQKKWILMKQGDRINRDLHDEIGSNLGSIALLAEDLLETNQDEAMGTDLDDLSLMAREASASLREIVRVSDQGVMPLPVLLNALHERAKRVLRGVSVQGEISPDCPSVAVSLHVKRHLTMLFKEAIHNCARHSAASVVSIDATVDAGALVFEIRDNGCGFEAKSPGSGWGLSNMKQRAEEIGGELVVASKLGEGVSITLSVPLNRLEKEPKHAYETSNK